MFKPISSSTTYLPGEQSSKCNERVAFAVTLIALGSIGLFIGAVAAVAHFSKLPLALEVFRPLGALSYGSIVFCAAGVAGISAGIRILFSKVKSQAAKVEQGSQPSSFSLPKEEASWLSLQLADYQYFFYRSSESGKLTLRWCKDKKTEKKEFADEESLNVCILLLAPCTLVSIEVLQQRRKVTDFLLKLLKQNQFTYVATVPCFLGINEQGNWQTPTSHESSQQEMEEYSKRYKFLDIQDLKEQLPSASEIDVSLLGDKEVLLHRKYPETFYAIKVNSDISHHRVENLENTLFLLAKEGYSLLSILPKGGDEKD